MTRAVRPPSLLFVITSYTGDVTSSQGSAPLRQASSEISAPPIVGTFRARLARVFVHVAPLAVITSLGIPICPVRIFYGKPCPGCGLTRAAFALAHGDLSHASELNPLAIVVVPIALAMIVFAIASYLRDGRTRMNHPLAIAVGALSLTALYVVWMMRWFGAFGGPVPV